ncbi:AEX-3 domain-containing protein, partial [Pavlovales sp. CCMP2436]
MARDRPFLDLFYVAPTRIREAGETLTMVKLAHAALPAPVHAMGAAPPPDRLLHFALPAELRLDAESLEKPVFTASFCLTDSLGAHAYGCGLTVLDAADDGSVVLWGAVMLSSSAIVDVLHTLLLSLAAQRGPYGLGAFDRVERPISTTTHRLALTTRGTSLVFDATLMATSGVPSAFDRGVPSTRFRTFCASAAAEVRGSAAVLEFLQGHHLWSGVSLLPLCKALRWSGPELAHLLLCLLTDQRILLFSSSRELLYPASTALQGLVSPFKCQGVFIPFLPFKLLQEEEARTLLNECAQPFLIGCERALVDAVGTLSDELVVVDLDSGLIRRPKVQAPALEKKALLQMRCVRTLCARLQE